MENTSFLSAVIVAIESATGMSFAWFVALVIIVVIEVLLRLIPTKNEGSILNKFLGFIQSIVNGFIPDRKKDF